MAGKIPFFLTGGNARILLNNKTVAFATDVSYRVSIKHASPRVLGRYEVEVNQPLAYDVSGSLTIIRYARGLKDFLGSGSPNDVSVDGNGLGSFKSGSKLGVVGETLGLPNEQGLYDGAADEALIPQRFFQSKQFNIEIRQKVSRDVETSIVLLRDCRIEEFVFDLTKRGVAVQRLSFRARYADDDTAIARKSGVGQELS